MPRALSASAMARSDLAPAGGGDRASLPNTFEKASCWGEGPREKRERKESGRSRHWIKSKNPNAPAVKREAEEDWGRWKA
jgi:hypothetical protein